MKFFHQMVTILLISDTWMLTNKLKINNDKTKFFCWLPLFLPKVTTDIQISIGKDQISPSPFCKSLGIMFDQHLSMVNCKIKACTILLTSTLSNIRNIRYLLTSIAATHLVHSLVISRLDYCNALLHRVPECRIRPLRKIQNSAASSSYNVAPNVIILNPCLKSTLAAS